MLNLIYITNESEIAQIADSFGVNRIFIDLETLGKYQRQKYIDSVKSQHKTEDITIVKSVLKSADLLVRVNPINEQSQDEIDRVINGGADIVMLPMFKTACEVDTFLFMVNARAKTCLLLETADAVLNLDEILGLNGIDEIHIGLNDLHLSMALDFLFEPLAEGILDKIFEIVNAKAIPCGFGGVAHMGSGELPAESILTEHYRLKSQSVILSRKFCDYTHYKPNLELYAHDFNLRIREIREFEKRLETYTDEQFAANRRFVAEKVGEIVLKIRENKKGSISI